MAQRAETTVAECSLTSCVWACFRIGTTYTVCIAVIRTHFDMLLTIFSDCVNKHCIFQTQFKTCANVLSTSLSLSRLSLSHTHTHTYSVCTYICVWGDRISCIFLQIFYSFMCENNQHLGEAAIIATHTEHRHTEGTQEVLLHFKELQLSEREREREREKEEVSGLSQSSLSYLFIDPVHSVFAVEFYCVFCGVLFFFIVSLLYYVLNGYIYKASLLYNVLCF